MLRKILGTAAVLVAFSAPAFANTQVWNVTEEGKSGIKSSQGTWSVTVDANNKVSGKADLQSDKGAIIAYTIDGSLNDLNYTVNLVDRSDGKKGCVWSGHAVAHTDVKFHGLVGEVHCADNAEFVIRAGF